MEINKDNWKQIDLNVDSLWLIPERDRQAQEYLSRQFRSPTTQTLTNAGNTVLELFAGSGTTLFAYENLRKDYIGFAPPKKIIDYVNSIMSEWSSINYAIKSVDVTDRQPFSEAIAA